MTAEPVIVLGAGLAGVCTALALRRRGRRVTILDQAADCLQRASLRNEGKIHLGLVYANDPSARTATLMLEAAFQFDRIVEGLVGAPVDWAPLRSSPFRYAVLPGSLRTPGELHEAGVSVDRRRVMLLQEGPPHTQTWLSRAQAYLAEW